ncbi:hypothetical protein [Rhodalgimonas zhirmunskyi]|uniref:Uncharacterized protein n=1 Tax=Rhodalgimonas zhirmunskyi TaxID=2964767 RepID=A0AAJ1X3W5_9RHOB|nr:hypothetical protein [Rhodoalgimonas zhirmunskyi]MDQ2092916.1 hypothetical protein [Rhodoalgimonas zhirmunskyi]
MTQSSFQARIRRIEAHHRDPDYPLAQQATPGVSERAITQLRKGRAHLRHVLALRRGAGAGCWAMMTVLLAAQLSVIDGYLPQIGALMPWRDQIIAAFATALVLSGGALAVVILRALVSPDAPGTDVARAIGALAGVALGLALPVMSGPLLGPLTAPLGAVLADWAGPVVDATADAWAGTGDAPP